MKSKIIVAALGIAAWLFLMFTAVLPVSAQETNPNPPSIVCMKEFMKAPYEALQKSGWVKQWTGVSSTGGMALVISDMDGSYIMVALSPSGVGCIVDVGEGSISWDQEFEQPGQDL